jgi:hypothetical protein
MGESARDVFESIYHTLELQGVGKFLGEAAVSADEFSVDFASVEADAVLL